MRILLLDCPIVKISGHDARSISLPGEGGIVYIQKILNMLERQNFHPDVLLQCERLGKRIFLKGLEDVEFPKIFWAIDSHLNMHWQRWYVQLFDYVLTPHVSIFQALCPEWQPKKIQRCIFPGILRPWIPHAERSESISFVGVIDENRQARKAFANILDKWHNAKIRHCSFHEMLDLYSQTCILPNECIANEFNFRITEGASCGCCVLTPDIGADLEANFTPGKEVLTYKHILEMHEILGFLKNRQKISESIGQSAQKRVLSEHLSDHKGMDIARVCEQISARKRTGSEIKRIFALTCLEWARSAPELRKKISDFEGFLDSDDDHIDTLSMKLRLRLEENNNALATSLLNKLSYYLLNKCYDKENIDAHTVCAVGACRLHNMPLFLKHFTFCKHFGPEIRHPENEFQALLCWAEILEKTNRISQPGFTFESGVHCPETALECLLEAGIFQREEHERKLWIRRLSECCDRTPLKELSKMSHAQLSIDNPTSWQHSLSYAISCLAMNDLQGGMDELRMARQLAEKCGEVAAFEEALRSSGCRHA